MLLVFGFVVILFFSMSKSYYRAPPKRETYPVAGKIIWAALKRCNCSSSGSCLDSAKKYHDPVQVEEVKSALDVLSVLYVMPLFWGVFFQIYSIWIFQASKMDCQFGSWTLPYSQVAILNPAFDIILIILFDRLLWPFCRRLGLPLKPLRKIGVGFIFTIAALLIAGSVELSMENSDNLVSILWILPQFFVISLAEILLAVTAYEIAYTQAPDSMKGFVTAMWEFTLAIGNVITALLVLMPWTSSTNSFILAGIICFAMILYLLLSWRYSKILARKEKLIAGMELDKRKKNTESNFS
ncbi:POT family MFS transporter [Pelomyxa schiedti]|nr:POT family MFS transporter [Pelomyxa schiedti]